MIIEHKKWNPINSLKQDVDNFVEMHCASLENAPSRESVKHYEPDDAGKMTWIVSRCAFKKEVTCF